MKKREVKKAELTPEQELLQKYLQLDFDQMMAAAAQQQEDDDMMQQ